MGFEYRVRISSTAVGPIPWDGSNIIDDEDEALRALADVRESLRPTAGAWLERREVVGYWEPVVPMAGS